MTIISISPDDDEIGDNLFLKYDNGYKALSLPEYEQLPEYITDT